MMSSGILNSKPVLVLVSLVVIAAAAIALYFGWSRLGSNLSQVAVEAKTSDQHSDHHGGAEHDHSHAGHEEANSLELSEQARRNIGLQTTTVELAPFEKTITVPGMIVERPGRTTIEVTAPMTGVILSLAAVQGEVVQPGQVLAEMRLSHEELVQAQGDLLRTAESLDVTKREIERIRELTKDGAIAGKTLIDLNYEEQKAEAILRAQSQTLILHGLSKEQVAEILKTRMLLPKLSVVAPEVPTDSGSTQTAPTLQIQELRVAQGQHVTAGDVLFVLADHRELFIEGKAFERDVQAIGNVAAEDWKVSAIVESKSARPEDVINGLSVLYLANKVDPDSRAFRFYVTLPNRVLREKQAADGKKFLDWEFKPGQRVQVRVPVEQWNDRIVLPIDAVANEGTESFVFQANGDHFDRRPVHVEYRDQVWAVIANDGSIFPGDVVAKSGAFQLQAAIKNKSGGAVDPHAGHNH
jgi:multidrug efflux pump subunit AcrA (membrane-fusion protein)